MSTATHGVQILVVEDEEPIRQMLRTSLELEGFVVHEARDVAEGRAKAANRRIDLFLVDLGLPDGDGVQLIREIRRWSQRPILVLSARAQENQKVEALDAGADDYLTKPFGVSELHARLRVAQRLAARSSLDGGSVLRVGACLLDLRARTVRRAGTELHLTATQWRLLEVLARQAGRVVTGRQLLREVWGPGHAEQSHYLRIYVRQLRQKIESDPAHPTHLLTETGVGYRLVASADDADPA